MISEDFISLAIDILIPEHKIISEGIAYYRIDSDFRDFILQCVRTHGVIGFSYDFESLNFGVVLQGKEAVEVQTKEEAKRVETLAKKLEKKAEDIKKKSKKRMAMAIIITIRDIIDIFLAF